MATEDIIVPSLGESVTEAVIAKWFKQPGDAVQQDEPLVELETDKVTMEVNAPASGALKSIAVNEDDTVEVGAVLGAIEVGAAGNASAAPAAKAEAAPAPATAPAASAGAASGKNSGPAVNKMLAENPALDAKGVPASGKDGRHTKGDIQGALAKGDGMATRPAEGPREERVKMSKLRQVIAKRLKESQDNTATLTTFNEVDMTNLLALRSEYKDAFEKKHGTRLGFMGFFLKAAVHALQEIPEVNAQIDGTDIIYKNFYDIGVAVGTPTGLVVPVIRDCDQKSIAQIEQDIANKAIAARDGKLGMSDMTGGTFTVSNGGVYGSLMSTPILNPPQSGILGMHKTEQRPIVMPDGSIQARPMMYLALSYDHRIIDGKESVTFLVRIKEAIEDPRRLILAL